MLDIAVIVVNWNVLEDLRRSLASIFAEPKPSVEFDVWLIDNASADKSVEMVESEFPQVHLIRNNSNRGFSRANNQGIFEARKAGYRYAYLINADAYLHTPQALDKIVAFGDSHPKAGVFGTRVVNPDGSIQYSCRRFPTLGAGFFRNTLLGRFFPKNRYARLYLMDDIPHDQERQVDWVSGCSMVIRTDMVEQIGALDEQFFMYCEDVDLCQRAWDAGFEVWYSPDAIVTHKIGGSSDKNAEPMIREFHRSWALYDQKHHPGFRPLRRLAVESGLWLRAEVRIFNRRRAQSKRVQTGQKEPKP